MYLLRLGASDGTLVFAADHSCVLITGVLTLYKTFQLIAAKLYFVNSDSDRVRTPVSPIGRAQREYSGRLWRRLDAHTPTSLAT
jgi:hypothetical protein